MRRGPLHAYLGALLRAAALRQLLKRSQHVKEWRSRYFILRNRKIYYYENEEEATPTQNGGKAYHKGYIDLVGCGVETFEDVDDGGEPANLHVYEVGS